MAEPLLAMAFVQRAITTAGRPPAEVITVYLTMQHL
jgi:hypothetical protein